MKRVALACVLSLTLTVPVLADDGAEPSKPVAVVDGRPVYGELMPAAGTATPVAQVLANPEQYTGQPMKFSGRIGQVCQKKGCWMMLTDGEQGVRVKFGDHAFFIPMDSQGEALVYGTLEVKTIDEKMAKHLAEDAGQDPSKVSGEQRELRIVATSLEITPAS